jgi:peptidoglycan hydrolase CwlO-like protein
MESSTVIWVIVAIVVVLVVIAAAVALSRRASARRTEHKRERAGELREQAAATQQGIRRRQADVDAADARAREMRAVADRKLAEAKRLESELGDLKSTLHEHVRRRDEVNAEADEIDPDIDTDAESAAGDTAAADEERGESRTSGEHRR